jgi:hypothetical protein
MLREGNPPCRDSNPIRPEQQLTTFTMPRIISTTYFRCSCKNECRVDAEVIRRDASTVLVQHCAESIPTEVPGQVTQFQEKNVAGGGFLKRGCIGSTERRKGVTNENGPRRSKPSCCH